MAPKLAQFEQQVKGTPGLEVVDVNVDNQDITEKYKQYKKSGYIPETAVVKNGQEVFDQVGVMSAEELTAAVEKSLK